MKEATARIKINKLLEAAGWRFFADADGPANIQLEPNVKIVQHELDDLGEDFEHTKDGFIDFLLLNESGRPLLVLEAKAEDKDPLAAKEQARTYAKSQNCRFVILSNGNLHYFWDLQRGNPYIVAAFPRPGSVEGYQKVSPNPARLVEENVHNDYIALTQRPTYSSEAAWLNESERPAFIETNGLRFLREYQLRAVHSVQAAVKSGHDRFLFEMATGTGKTLVAAAIIKLFMRTNNAQRVLFLVDRLELEDQAQRAFTRVLANDFKTVIYKERRDDWRSADIVVTTVQSLLFNNKYQQLFSPTDFDLVISDEAHRSISGNARAVFDFFVGYKLGLTATPRDYLKHFDGATANDPREAERRLLLDTYKTFGCESGQPTFRYSLVDGVKDGFLVSPTVVDARTDVTTQLLSDEGFIVTIEDEHGEEREETYGHRDFEKRFFAEGANELFCKTFLENALRDPVSGEIGKSIIFAVSQRHAARLAQLLNAMAAVVYPGKYQSDFAVQVTSQVSDAPLYTRQFANNNLEGSANFIDTYRTSKARVCVTVGMMTTGYDCPDILNLGLFRPIFSPTDFIQIKGRGTRKHNFLTELHDPNIAAGVINPEKATFKLFDFFANCEYFEAEFNYDEVLDLPKPGTRPTADDFEGDDDSQPDGIDGAYQHLGQDTLASLREQHIGYEGMKIDRMYFDQFSDDVHNDPEIPTLVEAAVESGHWDKVIDYVNREVFDRPEQYYNLDRLRKAASVDRRVTLREILEKVFDFIPKFKSKDDLLEEEFAKFLSGAGQPPEPAAIPAVKAYFKAYITDPAVRDTIDSHQYGRLATNPAFSINDLTRVPPPFLLTVPEYIKDYVPLNKFAA